MAWHALALIFGHHGGMSNSPPFRSDSDSGPAIEGAIAPFRGDMQGAAEAGLFFSESELPIRSHFGGPPATLDGYHATDAHHPLPPCGSDDGSGLPPTGMRR